MKLLDNKEYDKKQLIDNMFQDEFYYSFLGLDKALSYSSLKWLLKSPKWFEYKRRKPSPETQALRDGKLVHTEILEPEKYSDFNFIDVSSKNTKKWKLAVEEYGKVYTYTMKEKYMNNRISSAFLQNDRCVSFMNGSETEVPAIETIEGLPIRAKADILGGSFIVDLKTTGKGGLQKFKWSADNFGYDVQCYIYCELFDISYKDFLFAVIEKETHLMGLFECSKEFYERGRYKTEEAIQIYRDFFLEKKKPVEEFYLYDVL